MLDSRKSAILRKVVAQHIETGQPVGSTQLVKDPDIDVSPATVRSDMASLEREGYLTHPHTSAGRVPTDLGYRFFVDHLDGTMRLDPSREDQVRWFFERAHSELEAMLRDTSRLLSQLTDQAAVVVGPTHEALVIRSALVTRLAPRAVLLVVVLSNGVVEKHTITIDESLDDVVVGRVDNILRERLIGTVRRRVPRLEPSGEDELDRLIDCCREALAADQSAPNDGEVYVGGAARMAENFEAAETVRRVLSVLEQSFVVVTLLSNVLDQGQFVSIGAENHVASLAECSLVVAPYTVDEEVLGTIGVLGPTRMNYPQALAAVAVVSQRLGQQLSAS